MSISARQFNPSNSPLVDRLKEAADVYEAVINELPDSRRKSVALTHLETASMFAVKAVFVKD